MPYKITNITHKTLKNGLPLQLAYTNGMDKHKKVLEIGQHFYLYFLPKEIHQFQIRNFVHVEFVKNIEPDPIVTPVNKEVKIIKTVPEITTNVNDVLDTIINSDEEKEGEITSKKTVKKSKNKDNEEETTEDN